MKEYYEYGLKKGLLIGAVMSTILLVDYLSSPSSHPSKITTFVVLFVWVGAVIYFLIKKKKTTPLYTTRIVFILSFLMMVSSTLIEYFFNFVLQELIDPEIKKRIFERSLDDIRKTEDLIGDEMAETLENAMHTSYKEGEFDYNLSNLFGRLLAYTPIYALISFILALILKRRPVQTIDPPEKVE